MDQLPPDALTRPKVLLATAGSDDLADSALEIASAEDAALVVCFVRQVSLSYKVEAETRLTLDTDPAAQALFTDFLEHGHRHRVPIIPVYDTGPDSAELIAEHAAMNGVSKVLLGSSRRGAIHKIIKGSFQRKLESFLPPDVPVQVVEVRPQPPTGAD
jgi:nucleotide-binding universal stress UspA family protein